MACAVDEQQPLVTGGGAVQLIRHICGHEAVGSTVYKWNEASKQMHESLGFQVVGEDEKEYVLERVL